MRHQILEHHLVHAQRRGEHAGADVRDVEALEQALHGPVLAERAVQDREHDVDAGQPPPRVSASSRSPSERQTPSRPISISTGSWPAARRPSRTDAAEASDTSCSDERPPPSTATRRPLTAVVRGRGRWSLSRSSSCCGRRRGRGRRRRVYWPTTIVTVLFLGVVPRAGDLRQHDPVLALSYGLGRVGDLEAGAAVSVARPRTACLP